MLYIAFQCRKCSKVQGTYYAKETDREKKTCKCKGCGFTTKLYSIKNPTKILKESTNLSTITNIIKEYSANKENVLYDYQQGDRKQNWETEIKVI